jgi:glycosyltransferase involved in cell wall biosynthesis
MISEELPFVSIIIPTLNAGEYLNTCLESIRKQTYSRDRYEIIIADGGSRDNTVIIANKYDCVVVNNPFRLAEKGKAIGLKSAKGDIIGFIDSDNEVVQNDWLEKLINILKIEPHLAGVESNWLLKPDDPIANRYCCLIRQEDPISRQFALLSRCADTIDKGEYIILRVKNGKFPIFGANGFLWPKKVIAQFGVLESFDEADLSAKAVINGYNSIGNVKGYGVYHNHVKTIWDFFRKRYRQPHLFLERKESKSETWLDNYSRWEFIRAVLNCIFIVQPTFEAFEGMKKDGDPAWLLHPVMAFATFSIYSFAYLKIRLKLLILSPQFK